eukprot:2848629-Amphidinium_carterae.1
MSWTNAKSIGLRRARPIRALESRNGHLEVPWYHREPQLGEIVNHIAFPVQQPIFMYDVTNKL